MDTEEGMITKLKVKQIEKSISCFEIKEISTVSSSVKPTTSQNAYIVSTHKSNFSNEHIMKVYVFSINISTILKISFSIVASMWLRIYE